jgi:hypothetical protein
MSDTHSTEELRLAPCSTAGMETEVELGPSERPTRAAAGERRCAREVAADLAPEPLAAVRVLDVWVTSGEALCAGPLDERHKGFPARAQAFRPCNELLPEVPLHHFLHQRRRSLAPAWDQHPD